VSRSSRSLSRRMAVAIVAVIAVFGLFTVRLVDIQVVRAETLKEDAAAKRVVEVKTHGIRGDIVDRNGVVLADSVERYNITASPRNVNLDGFERRTEAGETIKVDMMDELAKLGELTGQKAADIRDILAAQPESDYAIIKKDVNLETLLKVRELKIPGLYDEMVPSRTYPNGAVAGNLVGFIGTDGPQAGFELTEGACLAAEDGDSTVAISEDWVQLPGSRQVVNEAKNGGTLRLTIDQNLQWYAQQALAEQGSALGADWATATVVRVGDGHIMAAADWPSVDPNDRNSVDASSLGARIFSTPYEPGSTIKAATIASYLDAGTTTVGEKIIAPGQYTNGLPSGSFIKDAWAHDDLRYTTAGVLKDSSNTGIAVLTEGVDAQKRHDYLRAFGFDQPTGIEFNGESSGRLIPVDQLDSISNITQQFGQGMTATSAQVAGLYQTLGNGGVRMPLTLVSGCELPDGTMTMTPSTTGERVVSEYAADTTVQMMETVASQGALASVLSIPGYRVAAKTGTAEVAENGAYGADRIVSVAGLVPAEDPKYAIVVTFAKPDTMKTSAAAAPTFNAIMEQVIKTFRITPSNQAAPNLPLTW
jgi:cell division protein FtsI (penicillin-binding protein 3)